jgi:hypothetical protein
MTLGSSLSTKTNTPTSSIVWSVKPDEDRPLQTRSVPEKGDGRVDLPIETRQEPQWPRVFPGL